TNTWRQAAHRVAAGVRAFLTRHISDTVKSWDARLTNTWRQAAHRVAAGVRAFLTRHISDTVKSWDAR
ncbi:hypothetical protein C7D72_30130, partial [Klebsiella pneumoniae]